jgi:glutamate-1-semialdehyde 2,1-aminomutase
MAALRVARGYTHRDVIVKFEGCYHGHADCLLVKAGSGAATFDVPASAGVPSGSAANTATLAYNDMTGLKELFSARGHRIAAVIVEPVVGHMGLVPPAPRFLQEVIAQCNKHGAVSIFDEVMTGSRLALGGYQEKAGLKPDMTCLGKVIGGGMPLAVYGGKHLIMEQVAPLGPVYQAGTLSGNPVAVSAALATIAHLDAALYAKLEALGARLEKGLKAAMTKHKAKGCVQRVGSMITLFFGKDPVACWADAKACDTARFGRWHQAMIDEKQYWPPSQYEAAFLSGAHTEADIDRTLEAAGKAIVKSGLTAV